MTAALIKRFERNPIGRDLIVGDIHGHFTKLQAALDEIGFDVAYDRLFSVGDLVDRGPESVKVGDWLAKPWFHAVQGNHEDMAIRWGRPGCQMDAELYMRNGGGWNVNSGERARAWFSVLLDSLPLAIELETDAGLVGIVHADCPFEHWDDLRACLKPDAGLRNAEMKALREAMLWDRQRITDGEIEHVQGVRAVVVGHTPVERWTTLGNVHFIDTGAWLPRGDRAFTLLDAATLEPARAEVPA